MGDLFKCGNCKDIYIDLFEFLDHKSQCVNTSCERTLSITTIGTSTITKTSSIIPTTTTTTATTTEIVNPIIINPTLTNFPTLHYENSLIDIPNSISTIKTLNLKQQQQLEQQQQQQQSQYPPVIIQSTKLNPIQKYYSNPRIIISTNQPIIEQHQQQPQIIEQQPQQQQQNQTQQSIINYHSINNINNIIHQNQSQSQSSSSSSPKTIIDIQPIIIHTEYKKQQQQQQQPKTIKCIKKITDIKLFTNKVNSQQLIGNNYPIITDITDILQSSPVAIEPLKSISTTTTTTTTTATIPLTYIQNIKSIKKPRCNNNNNRKKSITNDRNTVAVVVNSDDNGRKNLIENNRIIENIVTTTTTTTSSPPPPLPIIKKPMMIKPKRQRKLIIRMNPDEEKLVNGRRYQCPVCGCRFSRNKIKGHMSTHLVWPETLTQSLGTGNYDLTEGNYRCKYCSIGIETFIKLRTHMHTVHKNVRLYMCPMSACRQLFAYEDLIIEHSQRCAFQSPIKCPICFRYFSAATELDIHLMEHNNNNNINNKKYGRRQTTKIENESINLENITKPLLSSNNNDGDVDNSNKLPSSTQCPICFVKYKNEIRLLKHLHTDNHEHLCEICNKMFMHNRALTKHLRTHRDYKRICPVCNKSFSVQAYLTAHLLTHTGRQYICDICGKATTRKDSLARHLVIHQFPLKRCPFQGCNKLFRRSDLFRAHQNTHKTEAKLNSIPLKYSNNCKKIIKTTNDNKIDSKRLKSKSSHPYLKRNVIIPGIVVKSGKITKGKLNLKRYSTANNNNNNNIDNDALDKDENVIEFKKCQLFDDNQQEDNLLMSVRDKKLIDANRNNFEFVDCKPFNIDIIPLEIEKKKQLNKTEIMDYGSEDANELIPNNTTIIKTHGMQTRGKRVKIIFETSSRKNSINKKSNTKNLIRQKSKPLKYSTRLNAKSIKINEQTVKNEPKIEEMKKKSEKEIVIDVDEPQTKQIKSINNDTQTINNLKVKKLIITSQNTISKYPKWDPKSHINTFFTRLSLSKKNAFAKNVVDVDSTVNKFECNLCGRRFHHNKLFNHIQSHRVWPFSKKPNIGNSTFDKIDKLYHCPYCPTKTFHLYSTVRSHMLQWHINEKLFICPLTKCKKLFSNDVEFLKHCHDECVFKSTVRCTICYRFFSTVNELHLHRIIFHKIIIDCNAIEDNQNDHLVINGGNLNDVTKPGKDKQKNSDDDDDDDDENIIIIDQKQKYECKICLTKFKTKILLIKHMTNETHNHKCLYCDKKYLTITKFHRHTLTHRRTPKICHICGKIFTVQAYLNSHLLAHTESFTCDICQQTFTRRDSLTRHLNRHRQPLYVCTHTGCKAVYRRKDLIVRHLLKNDAHKMLIY